MTQPEIKTSRETLTARLIQHGAIAVLRLRDSRLAAQAIDAIHAGGIRAIEVTVTTPGAIALIEETARRFGDDILLGVGSVLDVDTARRAVDAGARYVVSPVFKPELIEAAHAAGVPAMPGAFTPSEILRAHEAGADVVKVFPAEAFGVAFFRAVLAPMPFLRIMPTGGVTPANVGEWLRAGAAAVGVGSALFDPALLAAQDFTGLTERARVITRAVADVRNPVAPVMS